MRRSDAFAGTRVGILHSGLLAGRWRCPDMLLVARGRQLHLLLAFSEASFLLIAQTVVASRAADALLVKQRGLVLVSDRVAAAVTLIIAALVELVIDRHAIVEYKALPFQALSCGGTSSRYLRIPPCRWKTSSKPSFNIKDDAFSQRIPPVQNMATFLCCFGSKCCRT